MNNANKKLHICIISLLVAILAVASVSLGILISGHDAEKSDVTSEAKAEAFQNALNAYKIYLNNYGESTCCYWSDGIFTFCNTNDEWQECSKKHNHNDDLDISGWQNGEPGKLEMSKALQEAKNAYTESLVKVLADGVIDETTDIVTFGGTEYTFTYANGALNGVTGKAGYTYNVANGTITGVAKNSNS
jgi:hypothetical protein